MFTLNCKGRLLTITEPLVMGIINTTPDSFFEGSRKHTVDAALVTAEKMIQEGATILDLGAQSTRPGSEAVGAQEEIQRLQPILEAIIHHFPEMIVSVDTYYGEVAKAAVDMGASIINDISGGQFDSKMLETVSALKVPYVCMHVKGNAHTMHQVAANGNMTQEVLDYFIERKKTCLAAGIADLILDPGFGFSKTVQQNFDLIKSISDFKALNHPILMGVSRKSTIYKTLGITVEEALNGTTVLHTAALLAGADILRVHDVKEAMEAIRLTRYLMV